MIIFVLSLENWKIFSTISMNIFIKAIFCTFRCPKCPKTFTQHHNLKRHCLKHHNENGKYCTSCNMWFKKDDTFEAHKTLHKQTKQPKLKEIVRLPYIFQCSLCGKGFASAAKLNAHQNVHKQMNYKCMDCDMEFEERDDYCDHVKTNHKEGNSNFHFRDYFYVLCWFSWLYYFIFCFRLLLRSLQPHLHEEKLRSQALL